MELINIIIENIKNLKKEQISVFLGEKNSRNKSKQDYVNALIEKIKDNEILQYKLYETYTDELSLHPTQVENILKCTKTERKRWTDEGKLKVVKQIPFVLYGKEYECPYYDAISISQITEENIEKWREELEREKKENRIKAIEKRKKTIDNNEKKREDFKKEFKNIVKEWYKIDSCVAITYELAYWTVWISRWAKEYRLKSFKAIKKQQEYLEKEKELYKLKEKAIEFLLKSSFKEVGLYIPQRPNKEYIEFCDEHYELWTELRKFDYMNKWEFFNRYKNEIINCPKCIYNKEENYYSLYYLKIKSDKIPNYSFSFHVPYNIGYVMFSNVSENIPIVQQKENEEGIFRFGRTLFEDEKIIYTEKFVLKHFNEALEKYQNLRE